MQVTTFKRAILRPTSTRRRILAIAALGFLLGGCFDSKDAKFPLGSGTPALGEGGRFTAYSDQAEGGGYQKSESIAVKRRDSGGYEITDEKGETHVIYLQAISGGRYVLQKWDDTITRYVYLIVRITPKEVLVYNPPCEEQRDRAKLETLGVEFYSTLECRIDSVKDPAALLATVDLGEPSERLVRESQK